MDEVGIWSILGFGFLQFLNGSNTDVLAGYDFKPFESEACNTYVRHIVELDNSTTISGEVGYLLEVIGLDEFHNSRIGYSIRDVQ